MDWLGKRFFFVIVKLLRIMTGLTSPEHAGLEKLFTNKKQIEWFAVHTKVFICYLAVKDIWWCWNHFLFQFVLFVVYYMDKLIDKNQSQLFLSQKKKKFHMGSVVVGRLDLATVCIAESFAYASITAKWRVPFSGEWFDLPQTKSSCWFQTN